MPPHPHSPHSPHPHSPRPPRPAPGPPDTARKMILPANQKRFIDLNTDYGQSGDREHFENPKASLLPFVSSVNIPCCVHDGNPREILAAIGTAKTFHCTVGAHIGYPDPANLGYEPMDIAPEDMAAWLYVQIGAFHAMVESHGLAIEHVRPHGALYGKFLTDFETARAVAETLIKINPWTILVGPAGEVLTRVHEAVGIRIAPEIILGKRYNAKGELMLDRLHDTLHPQGVIDQARQLIQDNTLTSTDGRPVKVAFKTLHISPRMPSAVTTAEKIYTLLGQPVSIPAAAVGESGWL